MPRPVPPGLWRRVPPAIFPPLLGAMGLVPAWRAAAPLFGLPAGPVEMAAGMLALLFGFAGLAYAVKLARRPAVLAEELRILPGRAGVAAGVLCVYLLAALVGPYAPVAGQGLLVAGLVVHVAALAVLLAVYRAGPPEIRRVTPVWHLNWVGFIVAARVAVMLGWPQLAALILWPALAAAVAIWAISAVQLTRGLPPLPLRPMLAIHAAPAALIGTVAAALGQPGLAWAMALASAGWLLVLALGGRWLLAAGFSAMWGALTFPLSTTAGLWVVLAAQGGAGWVRLVAALILVLASLAIPPILFLILRDWARGRLPVKTNAAIA